MYGRSLPLLRLIAERIFRENLEPEVVLRATHIYQGMQEVQIRDLALGGLSEWLGGSRFGGRG